MIATTNGNTADLEFRRLIWLMPAAFVMHKFEEFTGGFPEWVMNVWGGAFNDRAYYLNNAFFLSVLLALTLWVSLSSSRLAVFLLVVWASDNLFWDALLHIVTTARFDHYSPGLMTAALLYIPLTMLVGERALQKRLLTLPSLLIAVALGLGLLILTMWFRVFHYTL